jgi:hypothetical protein
VFIFVQRVYSLIRRRSAPPSRSHDADDDDDDDDDAEGEAPLVGNLNNLLELFSSN